MSGNYKLSGAKLSNELSQKLKKFLSPLESQLSKQIDARLVRTLLQLVQTIILFRNHTHGLLLSELGGFLLSPDRAPAGTKKGVNLGIYSLLRRLSLLMMLGMSFLSMLDDGRLRLAFGLLNLSWLLSHQDFGGGTIA